MTGCLHERLVFIQIHTHTDWYDMLKEHGSVSVGVHLYLQKEGRYFALPAAVAVAN